jgi:hypothetical protein
MYMKEGDAIIALVRGLTPKSITVDIGDTGTGKLYRGVHNYATPINFTWECIPVNY